MSSQANSDTQQSPEMVAYLLFERVVQSDDRLSGTRVSRTVLLDLYAECLTAVKGERPRRESRAA